MICQDLECLPGANLRSRGRSLPINGDSSTTATSQCEGELLRILDEKGTSVVGRGTVLLVMHAVAARGHVLRRDRHMIVWMGGEMVAFLRLDSTYVRRTDLK